MDQATLVGLEVDKGWKIVSTLDAADIDPKVALWMSTPEYEDGRLVLASTKLDQSHPLRAYEAVADALKESFVYTLPPILILRMKDPFIKALRELFGKALSVEGMRLGGQTIGNRFVSEAYVYRIR
jgi:hypothetical protein